MGPEPTPESIPADNVPIIDSQQIPMPPVVHMDQFIALYTTNVCIADPERDAGEVQWATLGIHKTWEIALGALVGMSGVRGIKIVRVNLPTYTTGTPLNG
jgi:hypothetical protein